MTPTAFSSPEPNSLPPEARARRRRSRRMLFPSDAEGQEAVLAELARRSYPSYDLYIYAILSGIVLAAGYLLDSQAVLFFGILAAPLLTPWVGLSIAAITGSPRFFFQTLAALLVSAIIVFVIGLAAGFASLPFEPRTHNEIYPHSILSWPNLIVFAFGALLLVVTFVRTENKPYLPISAAGFGLGAKLEGIWPQAAQVAFIHFAWVTLFGLLALAFMRFRPRSIGGSIFSLLVFLAIFAALSAWTGWGHRAFAIANGTTLPSAPTNLPHPFLTSSGTSSPRPTPSPSGTPPRPSATLPPTLLGGDVTLPATDTPLPTLTIEPTPVYAKVSAATGGGAYMRRTPGGQYMLTLENGFIVEVLGERQEVNGVIWVEIAVVKNGLRQEGWIIQSLLVMATPVVNWEPTVTGTPLP